MEVESTKVVKDSSNQNESFLLVNKGNYHV